MKKIAKNIVLVISILSLGIMLVACGDKNKDYVKSFQDGVNSISATNVELNEVISSYFTVLDDETKKTVIEKITALEEGYNAVKALESPKDYAEIHAKIVESCDIALSGLAIYKTEIESLTPESFDESFIDKLKKGDETMFEANNLLIEATNELAAGEASSADKDSDKEKADDKDEGDADAGAEAEAEAGTAEKDDASKEQPSSEAEAVSKSE